MENSSKQAVKYDLSNCEKEPIHIPGKVQSHGCLIAVMKETLLIKYMSSNLFSFLNIDSKKILDTPIQNIFTHARFANSYIDIYKLLESIDNAEIESVNPIPVFFADQQFNLVVNKANDFILLEFEPIITESEAELQRLVGYSLSRIFEARNLQHTLDFATKQIKDIIGYDRVMIYKFWEDDHGEVIAEARNENIEPFLGLHYPASDIPKQARELYVKNLVRIISDVNTEPSKLITTDDASIEQPLDLTNSVLRAVSPIHIQYLVNMGVAASFSISIIVKDKLWGLIACHNYTPRFIDFKARYAGKLIGQLLSSGIEYREENEIREQSRIYQGALQKIVSNCIKNWNIEDSLTKLTPNLLNITSASGAALVYEGNLYLLGQTPTEEQVQLIVKWLKEESKANIYHTNNLANEFIGAREFMKTGSGLLSCTLSKELNEYILWFKPELKETVKWAGNPDKPVEINQQGLETLSPRKSFALWITETEGISINWSFAEIAAAMKLREEIISLMNEKANQIRKLNEQLQKAYNELDTFSSTISHDLKTPLTSIKNYTEILLESSDNLSDDDRRILSKIIKNTDRMNLLIKEILSYSKIDRQDMSPKEVDMGAVINSIVTDLNSVYNKQNITCSLNKLLPLHGDETMIYQVFSNIIGNAFKYSSGQNSPNVEIKSTDGHQEVIYSITDNGIGINMNYGNQVFELFKRLENAQKFEGTGVGLAIVKRIMQKHQGKVWYESSIGNGTIFYLAFKKINK